MFHGFFSLKHAQHALRDRRWRMDDMPMAWKLSEGSIYRTPEGKEVFVTAVTKQRDYPEYNYDDVVYVGVVTEWVRYAHLGVDPLPYDQPVIHETRLGTERVDQGEPTRPGDVQSRCSGGFADTGVERSQENRTVCCEG